MYRPLMNVLAPADYYYVYITTNEDRGLLHTGLAGSLSVRLAQLESGMFMTPGMTDMTVDCVYLVYWERFTDVQQALTREEEIRKMSFKKKRVLISKKNPHWHFLNDKVHAAEQLFRL